MKWKIKQARMVVLDAWSGTNISIEVEVELENGSAFQCLLPVLSHPGKEKEVKALMAEYIDPYAIKEYVRSCVEAMVDFAVAINTDSKKEAENYIHFTEGILSYLESEEEE